jgi:hypothetical protein
MEIITDFRIQNTLYKLLITTTSNLNMSVNTTQVTTSTTAAIMSTASMILITKQGCGNRRRI